MKGQKRTILVEREASETLCDQAASLLERDIVTGALKAGSRLGIAALSERYSIGPTPVREALTRLVGRGFVDAVARRGFRVASCSRSDLHDLTEVRVLVEVEALRRSMENGGDEWESSIVTNFHRLRLAVERNPITIRSNPPDFEMVHRDFHRSLIDACKSPRLMHLHDELYLQALRYRCVMMEKFDDTAEFIRQHDRISELVLKRTEEALMVVEGHARQLSSIVFREQEHS